MSYNTILISYYPDNCISKSVLHHLNRHYYKFSDKVLKRIYCSTMWHSKSVSIFLQVMFTELASTLKCIKYHIKGRLMSLQCQIIAKVSFN